MKLDWVHTKKQTSKQTNTHTHKSK
jgi:hypothetical protein